MAVCYNINNLEKYVLVLMVLKYDNKYELTFHHCSDLKTVDKLIDFLKKQINVSTNLDKTDI